MVIKSDRDRFQNNPKLRPETAHKDSPQELEPYVADPELIQAVNLAIALQRPLLLEGEAGCGKTRLAIAVAYELGLPLYPWNVRSTSKAREGLYEYDAILRLHDVQAKQVDSQLGRNPADPKDYRRFGALGKAFQLEECQSVVLIDEIDKADLDFPNDLLTVLEKPWKFEIPETGETGKNGIQAKFSPIVIITSNKEKGNLPIPFLRRCVYYYVSFPKDSTSLQKIVEAHYQPEKKAKRPSTLLTQAAAERFLAIRKQGLLKNPGTSEFLDWLEALQNFGDKPYSAAELAKVTGIPYRELLLKMRDDWNSDRHIPPSAS
jgi:MoxR-like ATPase